ncbi:MAG: MMPL family transporter [Oscillospiraceae bacterium]|nr:MMPL family transporter [Oscillospiraceae bacterium]
MKSESKTSGMEKVATFIVDKKIFFIALFLAAAIFCAFSRNWVQVNESLTDYLPEETETRQGVDLMEREFVTYSTADVMVQNVTYDQAVALQEQLEEIPGVKEIELDETSDHYADASALFSITFDGSDEDEVSIQALDRVKEHLAPYDMYYSSNVGNPLKAIIDREMLLVDLIAVVIIVTVLLITSQTYMEIPVLLITFGAAALLNMGTNFMMGEISFVTDSIAIVLQLALAIDYAIILCHRFTDEHVTKPPREAAIAALSKAIPEISASSLTTVSGLLALTFMQYRLGGDIGSVLIKAILLSLCSVFLLMPGLLVIFAPLMDRTHHKSFVPRISFLGRFAWATRFIIPFMFLVVVIGACFFSNRVNYVYSQYSVSSIRQNDMQLAEKEIKRTFGKNNQMAILVPAGDYSAEASLISDIETLPHTVSVLGLASVEVKDGYTVTSSLTPRQFAEMAGLDYDVVRVLYSGYAMTQDDYGQIVTNLDNYSIPLLELMDYLFDERREVTLNLPQETADSLDDLEEELDDAKLQLKSEDWTRIVLNMDIPIEGEESYSYLNILHGLIARYYDKGYLVGDTTSCFDLRSSFEHDNLLISVLTIAFVILVLLFTFRSAGLPVLLIVIIQGSIWCNFAVPTLRHANLFFLTYLIISAIQMGANIDYAIVISSRYMELKQELSLKEAMIESLNHAFPTIITSGLMLSSAGIAIGFLTSNETISAIGVYLGIGTLISIFLVMCVLPQILLLGDTIINRTSFSIDANFHPLARGGAMHIGGHVRGNINGYIDADIRGLFYGDLNALVETKSVSSAAVSDISEPEGFLSADSSDTDEVNPL